MRFFAAKRQGEGLVFTDTQQSEPSWPSVNLQLGTLSNLPPLGPQGTLDPSRLWFVRRVPYSRQLHIIRTGAHYPQLRIMRKSMQVPSPHCTQATESPQNIVPRHPQLQPNVVRKIPPQTRGQASPEGSIAPSPSGPQFSLRIMRNEHNILLGRPFGRDFAS